MSVREILLLPSVLVKWVLTALNNTYTSLNFSSWQFAAHASLDFSWLQHRIWIRQDARDAREATVHKRCQDKSPKGEFWTAALPATGYEWACLHLKSAIWSSHSQLLLITRVSTSPRGTSLIPAIMHSRRGKEGSISCSVWGLPRCTKDFFLNRVMNLRSMHFTECKLHLN